MTIPLWVLLGFAAWTLLTLFTTVGIYRWTRILTGRIAIAEWRADEPQGSEWYRRAVRAHMNCVENLPIYTALVVVLLAIHADTPVLDALAIIILVARILQTVIHLSLEQTNTVAALRFACFFIQALCMIAMGVIAASLAASS
ncbi:MAG: MAPEG family protein [Rhodoplanes sp.]